MLRSSSRQLRVLQVLNHQLKMIANADQFRLMHQPLQVLMVTTLVEMTSKVGPLSVS